MATGGRSNGGIDDVESMPMWKSYLYQLQQKAPKPKRITSKQNMIGDRNLPYGREFHGAISREETDLLIGDCDGCYLVRESQRAEKSYTLAIRFDYQTKNFKLYYDGQHYVGEKRFDTIHDLVEDGLIAFYLESKAADYIARLSNESNYEESPYYRTKRKKQHQILVSSHPSTLASLTASSSGSLCPVHHSTDGTICSQDSPTSLKQALSLLGDPKFNIKLYEKAHNFKTTTFKGPYWCDYCANFMWGLIAQGVKCQDCGFNAHKKCSEKVPNDCMPDMKFIKRQFGVDLTTLVKAQNAAVPVVVESCVREIESRGVEYEGIYRVAGYHDDVEAIKLSFDKDGETDISREKFEDINTICSVLKSYFRELPIPIFTFDTYPYFLEAVQRENMDNDERLQMIYHTLNMLPPAHYQTLKHLVQHLARVTKLQRVNMMSPENLAIVFAPSLLRSIETDPLTSLTAAKYERHVVELMIQHHEQLFTGKNVL